MPEKLYVIVVRGAGGQIAREELPKEAFDAKLGAFSRTARGKDEYVTLKNKHEVVVFFRGQLNSPSIQVSYYSVVK